MGFYTLENKLVIAISSSALFNLSESDQIYREKGLVSYREHQRKYQNRILQPGVAFPFIKRLLYLNEKYPKNQPIEVILLSRNDPDTGLRVFNSISHYKLPITRAGFLSGKNPHSYISAFNASLFLSANPEDVKSALQAGIPAGTVLNSSFEDNPDDRELRIAFDFDGVLIDDQAEAVYQASHNLEDFQESERKLAKAPHNPGPLRSFFSKLSEIQKMEQSICEDIPENSPVLRTAIITARCAPAHERFVTTLRSWGIQPDETFFLGGIDKSKILEIFRPHIFFDDSKANLESSAQCTPSVHIPFGVVNK